MAAAPPWERFVAWAITRYGARLDVLELCNEPNLQGTAPETVAAMFVTAQRIAADLGSPVVLAGPATSDVAGYDRYTDRLLDALDARGFVAGRASRGRTTTTPTSPTRRAAPPTCAGASSGAGPAGRRATPATRSSCSPRAA